MVAAKRTILIAGDVTVDWMLLKPGGGPGNAGPEGIDFPEIWGAGFECGAFAQPGGAAMLAALVREVTLRDPALAGTSTMTGPTVPSRALSSPEYHGLSRTWASWSLQPRSLTDRTQHAWRMSSFWGQGCEEGGRRAKPPRATEGAAPDYLVIDDSDLGYRDDTAAWSRLLTPQLQVKAIVVKMTAPLATGALWRRLAEDFADVLTVVVPIADLRHSSVQVGDPLSWERTAYELQAAVRATDLVRASRVVVTIGLAGALLMERDAGCTLVFDPLAQQGDWERRLPGLVVGHATCTCAALVHDLLHGGADPVGALQRALRTMRYVHESGYDENRPSRRPPSVSSPRRGGHPHGLRFPYKAAAETLLADPGGVFARMPLKDPADAPESFLLKRLGSADLTAVACAVAVGGPERLPPGIPLERIGEWSSVDRSEIEGMREVSNLIAGFVAEYESGRRLKQPLSIAVFGPPGAGKSFAVKQIAEALMPEKLETCAFNLSQIRSEAGLPQAFHQVRDLVLRQRLPLVFWDEFDSQLGGVPLGWLRLFLAPMQDGEFDEGGVYHPIGPAVFVFAGGTSATLREFAEVSDAEGEKAAKKPDFLSRLRGYVDVFGPNPHGPDDVAYMLRRALLLRSVVEKRSHRLLRDGTLHIDEGVLRAFVLVDRFRHGARSMQAIVEMSSLSGKLRFDRSSLPPEDQLDLHVDGRAFGDLVRREA